MVDTVYNGEQYKLRAGTSMNVAPQGAGIFVLHTFMAELIATENYTYTTNLPASTDFRGQGGSLVSASFNRLEDTSGQVFSGQKVYTSIYIEEDAIPSITGEGVLTDTFMECTSLSITYDIMGKATVSYVLISKTPQLQAWTTIIAGGQTFDGYVTSITMNQIPKTNRYENHVSLIATTR